VRFSLSAARAIAASGTAALRAEPEPGSSSAVPPTGATSNRSQENTRTAFANAPIEDGSVVLA
jgi:hypothetical protein